MSFYILCDHLYKSTYLEMLGNQCGYSYSWHVNIHFQYPGNFLENIEEI